MDTKMIKYSLLFFLLIAGCSTLKENRKDTETAGLVQIDIFRNDRLESMKYIFISKNLKSCQQITDKFSMNTDSSNIHFIQATCATDSQSVELIKKLLFKTKEIYKGAFIRLSNDKMLLFGLDFQYCIKFKIASAVRGINVGQCEEIK